MFKYQTGVSADTNAFFPIVETFLIECGWVLVSGHGTQDMVFSSTGEGWKIPKTKLFIRIWKNGNEIHGRVQDDAIGTHATTLNGHVNDAAGANWTYYLSGDKDCLWIATVNAAVYRDLYIGLVLPFAINPPDETYYMVEQCNGSAYVLRRYDGLWNQNCSTYGVGSSVLDPFDNTAQLFGYIAGDPASARLGQFRNCSYTTAYLALGDTVTTGFNIKDMTTWICVRDEGARKFCIRTGGLEPTGDQTREDKSHFAVNPCFQVWDSRELFDTYLIPFLTGIGWTATDYSPTSGIDRDYIFSSTGESGLESIYIRMYCPWASTANFRIELWDDPVGTHSILIGTPLLFQLEETPVRLYMCADRDCIILMTYPDAYISLSQITNGCLAGYRINWLGRLMTFTPGLLTGNTPYSMAYTLAVTGLARQCRRLRSHAGVWTPAQDSQTNFGDSGATGYTLFRNPNQYDALTYTLFPVYFQEGSYWYGQAKYLYNVSVYGEGTPGDIIEIDSKVYQIFKHYSGSTNLETWYALRIQ